MSPGESHMVDECDFSMAPEGKYIRESQNKIRKVKKKNIKNDRIKILKIFHSFANADTSFYLWWLTNPHAYSPQLTPLNSPKYSCKWSNEWMNEYSVYA